MVLVWLEARVLLVHRLQKYNVESCNLIILKATPVDAGSYACSDGTVSGVDSAMLLDVCVCVGVG